MTSQIPFTEHLPAERPEHVGVMQLSAFMGELLLKNGGEIYRVQDTLNRIIDACGFPNHSVYVLSNGIFITINEGMPDACSAVRYVKLGNLHLNNIARLNQVSRDICDGRIGRDEAYRRLQEIEKPIPDRKLSMALCCGFGCGGFSVLFGGSLQDGITAFLVGILLKLLLYELDERQHITRFPTFILASFFLTLVSAICMLTGFPDHFDLIVIGSIMPLVPGYSLTTSIRDFFNGDYLSGLIHLIDALLVAFSIAVGVGICIKLISFMGGRFVL